MPPNEWPTRIGRSASPSMMSRVVPGDVLDAVVGDGLRVGAGLLDGVGNARPAGRDGLIAASRNSFSQGAHEVACSQRP